MKTHTRNNWKKRELLLNLYFVAFLHYLVTVSAAPSNRKLSLESTIHANNVRINDDKASESNQNAQSQRTNIPSISITKRSIQIPHLPDDYSHEFQLLSQKDCDDDPNLCTGKFHAWNDEEYDSSNLPDGENDVNRFIYNDMEKYYGQPAQDTKKVSGTYTLSQRTVPTHEFPLHIPKIIILALPKPTTKDQRQDESSENENPPIQESKKNIFTSRGWGAGGMPFSVLYLHQQQHPKPARSPTAGAQQLVAPPAPLRGFPSQYRQVAVRNALSSALTAANNVGGGGGGGAGTPLPSRRQYSIIPQLYVSYGWGPHGK